MERRAFLAAVALAAMVRAPAAFAATRINVYTGPECNCCGDWMVHLRDNGFAVVAHDLPDVASFRSRQGITRALASCHTALIEGYVVEGHVPASDIRRLLAERPAGARGLTVPGMETPFVKPQAYSVLLILSDGSTRIWRSYPGA